MTDNEIIKALECHSYDYTSCMECPFTNREECSCELSRDALDLINRQKAEIESNKAKIKISAECIARQDKEIERLKQNIEVLAICKKDLPQKTTNAIKAEAVKEFAERLKEKAWHGIWEINNHVDVDDIDNLVKEMVGAESG